MKEDTSQDQPLDTPVQFVKGVGPRRALLFEKLHIQTVGDLLYFVPRRYGDRRDFQPIASLASGETTSIEATVHGAKWVRPRYGKGYFISR